MTLLARRDGLSIGDFRSYWAGPHAALALGMEGISKYTHNRVDKILWASGQGAAFSIDGIVELYFRDEDAMRSAQASTIGRRHIPADEPNFLKGWTLCIVDTEGSETGGSGRPVKVIVPFLLGDASKARFAEAFSQCANASGWRSALNWTVSTARRERLWSEPSPPDGFAVLWFDSVAAAHDAFDEGAICRLFAAHLAASTAYLVDELSLR
ncbi:EthD domain-containing protein [Variovorax saccharolyticus]|uniref:EthD domain-containing protein n=1 Tax=Variovorax saccharolyticus TaxID=3053516 RepID=UPI00257903A5|nr:EthD domain-containing protein [Variovorax sp. J31P216]